MSSIEYVFSFTPGAGTGMEIYGGIYWLRLPLPFALDHINVWLLDNGESWTLIDTGPAVRDAREAWKGLFNSLVKDKPIKRLIVTHYHPDHIGLLKWLCEQCEPEVYMSNPTYAHAQRMFTSDFSVHTPALQKFCQAHDAPNPEFFTGFLSGGMYRRIVSGIIDNVTALDDDAEITMGGRRWRAIMSNGHARGHISFYCEESGLLISGDQVLPRITSNISLFEDDPDANPLEEYLLSLARIGKLPEDTHVMPSHGRIFRGLQHRIREIEDSHMDRNNKILSTCREPVSTRVLIDRIFERELDDLNWMFAFGETLAHIRYLEKQGRLRTVLNDGSYQYQSIRMD
jgi:glyoxylase-like metal-dependent hydrolase (beta-lactamase superfamily II)